MTRSSSTEDQPAGWQGMLCLGAPASARWSWSIRAAHQPGPVLGRSRQSCCPGTSCWKTWLPQLQTHTPRASTNTARCQDFSSSSHALLWPPARPGLSFPPAASPWCPGRAQLQAAAQRASQGAAPGTAPAALAEGAQKEPACPAVGLRLCSVLRTPSPAAGLPAQPSQLREPQAGIAGMEAEHTTSLETELAKLMGGTV